MLEIQNVSLKSERFIIPSVQDVCPESYLQEPALLKLRIINFVCET